ncbi:MAG: invasion associated locus B family protein [Pseudorhodobacter sp.]|nr:invasion associated locus B family protein [Pseudorhodobacter sp.]
MTRLLRTLTLGLGLMAGLSVAQAQTTTTATPPPGDAAAANDLSMGSSTNPGLPTQADAEVGKTYLAGTFDQWEQRCVKKADGSDPCQLYQLLKDDQGNDVAEISIFNLPDGAQAAAGATFMAPLETLLTANLKLGVDGKQPKVYPFAFCTKVGCVARLGFTADEIAALKKGTKATLTIVPAVAPDKVVDLSLTLKGFTAGYEAVKTANTKK